MLFLALAGIAFTATPVLRYGRSVKDHPLRQMLIHYTPEPIIFDKEQGRFARLLYSG